MTDTTLFPSRLRKILAMNNMTQAQLCRLTGISKGTMSNYISGTRHATNSNMYRISKALNIDIVWLMGFTDDDDSKQAYVSSFDSKKKSIQRNSLIKSMTKSLHEVSTDNLISLKQIIDSLADNKNK